MKTKRIFLALLALNAMNLMAQDVIVKKDGTPILTKVLEVNTDNVKYKKHNNTDGPTYTIAISDILSLTYANGDKEDFGNATNATTGTAGGSSSSDSQGLVQLPPDSRNEAIIRQYNTIYQPTKEIKKSDSKASRCFILCGVRQNSLMSNEELEMSFEAKAVKDLDMETTVRRYLLKLTNKTDKTIYIDKGNCFRVSSDGSSYTYFEPSEQTTVTHGGNTNASMNMGSVADALGIGGVAGQLAGGLRIGGGSSRSTSTTYSQQRILAITPHGFRYLTEDKFVKKAGGLRPDFRPVEKSEQFLFMNLPVNQIGISKDELHNGEVCVYSENDLPWNRKYVITYSTSETFNTYSYLLCDFFIKEIIGTSSPRNQYNKYWRMQYGEDRVIENDYFKYISSLDIYGIVGFTMFDGKEESGTGTIIGIDKY